MHSSHGLNKTSNGLGDIMELACRPPPALPAEPWEAELLILQM